MLISHKHRFIFLKTEKTASTSLMVLLREACGEEEEFYVAGPRTKRDLLSQGKSLADCSFVASTGSWRRKLPTLFGLHPHAKARDIRRFIGGKLFDQYTVITSERNPWDRQISLYCHRNHIKGSLDMERFNRDMQSPAYSLLHKNRTENWDIYSLDNQVCADIVIRYENLEYDVAYMFQQLGLQRPGGGIPRKRAQHRPGKIDYRDVYTDETRDLVGQWYQREIAHFGYEFGETRRLRIAA